VYKQQTTAGTKVELWPCNGQTNQQWTINSNGTITGVQSGLCLDAVNQGTSDEPRSTSGPVTGRPPTVEQGMTN